SIIGRPDRPKLNSASRFEVDATAPVLKAVVQGFAANFGTWSVNEADKSFVRRTEANLLPNTEGSETKYSVTSLTGDELKTTGTNPVSGVRNEAVYRRAR